LCCFDDPSPSQRVTHTTGMTHFKVNFSKLFWEKQSWYLFSNWS